MRSVRVLAVDDQATFRRAAQDLIDVTPRFEFAGEASSGAEALEVIAETQPELVLLDVRMPGMSGIETARRIRAQHPDVVVVLVSAEDPEDLPASAGDCGASALVRKQDLGPRKLTGIWATSTGGDVHRPPAAQPSPRRTRRR